MRWLTSVNVLSVDYPMMSLTARAVMAGPFPVRKPVRGFRDPTLAWRENEGD